MTITAEQLQQFCSTHDKSGRFRKPNTVMGITYATNGAIAVSVPATEGLVFECHRHFTESMASKLDSYMSLDGVELGPLNLPPEPAWSPCSRCEGTGRCKRCFGCDGEGELECDLGHMHECPDCGGDGQTRGKTDPCMGCDGSGHDYGGTSFSERAVFIGGASFDWRLLSRIAALPNAEVGLEEPPIPLAHEKRRLLFKFDGDGRGVLMPLNPDMETR